MKSILRQFSLTAALLGGWVFLLLILFLCGIPLPHTHAFARIGRLVGYDPFPRAKAAATPASAQVSPAVAAANAANSAEVSPAWYLPATLRMNLPQRIYAVPSVELSLYYENLVFTKVPDGLRCEVICQHAATGKPLGRAERRRWALTPTAADVGEHKIKVVFKDVNPKADQRPLAEGEFTLCVIPQDAGAGQDARLLIIGDSITHMTTWVNCLARLLSAPGNPKWAMLGTNKTPQALPGVLHEGYGGFIWRDFMTLYEPGAKNRPYRDISPFVYKNEGQAPAADLPRYIREHCDNQPPQFVFFELGSNDIFGLQADKPVESAYWIEKIVQDADNLLQAWRAAAPAAKLAILVPAQFSVFDLVYTHNYSTEFNHWRYRQNHFLYTEMLVQKFRDRERENIFVVRADAQFDPMDGYPVDNASHPNEYGAGQLAASAYTWMKSCLATVPAQTVDASKP